MNILRTVLIVLLYTSSLASWAQEDPCTDKCVEAKYESGRLSDDGNGACKENEDVVEIICCCSPKK